MTPLVDAHCHLDLYPDPARVLADSTLNACEIIAVTNAPSVFRHTFELTAKYATVHAAVGLHPQLVKTRSLERGMLLEQLSTTKFVGEIGLDYQTKDEAEKALQRDVFLEVVEACSKLGNRILTIHSRRASKDVLGILGESFRGTAILHYFSGQKRELDVAAKRGFYFSVNPAMVRAKSGQELIRRMEPDLVLTESDGPFVKCGRRAAEPMDVSTVVDYLSVVWGCPKELAGEKILANFKRAVGE